MTDLSLITSLYRSSEFLNGYQKALTGVLRLLQTHNVAVEVLLIANDPTLEEQTQLRQIQSDLQEFASVRLIQVQRETLYASWNRGLDMFSGNACSFWNVDDIHTADAYLEAVRAIQQGYTLIDFPYLIVEHRGTILHRQDQPVLYQSDRHTRKSLISTFAVFARSLIVSVGLFDARFRIAGDLDYSVRTVGKAKFYSGKALGGEFHLHSFNLSTVGNALQLAESNIVFLRQKQWDQIVPVAPIVMEEVCDAFEQNKIHLPIAIQEWLWGRFSGLRASKYQVLWRYRLLQRAHAWLVMKRLIPNFLRPPIPVVPHIKND